MNELQIFKNELFGEVRTVLIENEVWFVLIDVCKALDIKNPTQLAERLDDDERAMFNIGRQGNANIINESGLYKVIFRSDKKEVKPFTKWVTNEILPSARKHGMYATEELLDSPDRDVKANLRIGRVTKITPKGQAYFYKKFNNIQGGSLENK